MLASEIPLALPHATFALKEVARGRYMPRGTPTVLSVAVASSDEMDVLQDGRNAEVVGGGPGASRSKLQRFADPARASRLFAFPPIPPLPVSKPATLSPARRSSMRRLMGMKRITALALAVAIGSIPGLADASGGWRYGGHGSAGGYRAEYSDPAHYPIYPRHPFHRYDPPRPHAGHHRKHHAGCRHPAATVVVADPFYCNYCHIGFRFRHKFYHHLNHDHRIALEIIPSIVVRIGPTVFFID